MPREWIQLEDALNKSQRDACWGLDDLVCNDECIEYICHGITCNTEDSDCIFFHHNKSKTLNSDSSVIIDHMDFKTQLTLEELYYYLNIAYQNYIKDGQYPETIKLFTDGLEYFRKTCNIKGTIHQKKTAQQPQ